MCSALGGPVGGRGDGPVAVAEFIVTQRAKHQVPHATSCRALGVSPAWFYKWRHGDASLRRARLAALVAALFGKNPGTYGGSSDLGMGGGSSVGPGPAGGQEDS